MKINLLGLIGMVFFSLNFMACKQNNLKRGNSQWENESREESPIPDFEDFNSTVHGEAANLYYIENDNGMKAYFTNYGGRIVSLLVPDKKGNLVDVVLGFKKVEDYKNSTEPYFGAIIGRYGNRIAKGKFTLDGKEYNIPINNGENALHGGENGFQDMIWEVDRPQSHTIIFKYLSEDMEQGFPGNLEVTVTYILTNQNELQIEYKALTDKSTIVNLTNHAFFNLNGEGIGDILNHDLQIFANQFTPVNEDLIPTGEFKNVEGTPFNFTEAKKIGEDINIDNTQLKFGKGYDHNFVLSGKLVGNLIHAAIVKGDRTGIIMNVYTEEPGLQFYSGNFMESKNTLKSGVKDHFRSAFALETQHYPDSPNHSNFPSTVLKAGETYTTKSIYKFDVE